MAKFNRDRVTNEDPRYVTFNGSVGAIADDNSLKMKLGERSRIYFVNEGLNLTANFHPIGSHWDKVYPEAATHPDNSIIRGSQSTSVVAGGGTVVEMLGMSPSSIVLVDHALTRAFDKGDWSRRHRRQGRPRDLFQDRAAEGRQRGRRGHHTDDGCRCGRPGHAGRDHRGHHPQGIVRSGQCRHGVQPAHDQGGCWRQGDLE